MPSRASLLLSSMLVCSLLPASACSSDPPPSGPAETCVGYRDETRASLDGGGDAGDGGIVAGYAPTCIPFAASNLGSTLSCTVFATLDAPGDESLCGAAGLQTPDARTLQQLRAQQVPDWSTRPTCIVPQLGGAVLDAGQPCGSTQPGWCLAAGGTCESEVLFSPQSRPAGALVTVVCQNCMATAPAPTM
jgi:hypothetical protein